MAICNAPFDAIGVSFLQACVKKALHARQKIIPGTKFTLTRQNSDFNVFDTFNFLENDNISEKKARSWNTITQEETYNNEASADDSTGPGESFPGGSALDKLFFPQ
jgi:hypothetical protein